MLRRLPAGRPAAVLSLAALTAAALACGPVGLTSSPTAVPPTVPPEDATATPAPPTPTPSPVLPTATPAPDGTIAGRLSYPSEYIPRLNVVAFDAASLAPVAAVETATNQSTYELAVPPGVYFVVAYTLSGGLAGGYSDMVPCGLWHTCIDHALLPVTVESGSTTAGVDPGDWYAPDGAFPPAP